MAKLRFECQYCDAVFPDFKGLVDHFEDEHRHEAEYIMVNTEKLNGTGQS